MIFSKTRDEMLLWAQSERESETSVTIVYINMPRSRGQAEEQDKRSHPPHHHRPHRLIETIGAVSQPIQAIRRGNEHLLQRADFFEYRCCRPGLHESFDIRRMGPAEGRGGEIKSGHLP